MKKSNLINSRLPNRLMAISLIFTFLSLGLSAVSRTQKEHRRQVVQTQTDRVKVKAKQLNADIARTEAIFNALQSSEKWPSKRLQQIGKDIKKLKAEELKTKQELNDIGRSCGC